MQLEQIRQISVIGVGRMGHGIAQSFAMGGYDVRCYDASEAARDTLRERIRGNLEDFSETGMVSADDIGSIIDRIHVADSEADAASGSNFVVEAVAEQLDTKKELFTRLEEVVEDSTIIASNSSTFTISQSGADMRLPERAIVTHWFNPPHIVPTVEVVPGPTTTESVTQTTVSLHRKIGKLAVRVNAEIAGFLVNRVQIAMIREVWDLYERGVASAEDIDAAIRGSLGFRLAACGPLSICDFGGVDIWATVFNGLAPDLRSDAKLPDSIQGLLDDGRFGMRTGSGIHEYDPEKTDELTSQRDETMLKLAKLLYGPQ
jgi:3-hydroxybutyryl-CoA dehydrogenase